MSVKITFNVLSKCNVFNNLIPFNQIVTDNVITQHENEYKLGGKDDLTHFTVKSPFDCLALPNVVKVE